MNHGEATQVIGLAIGLIGSTASVITMIWQARANRKATKKPTPRRANLRAVAFFLAVAALQYGLSALFAWHWGAAPVTLLSIFLILANLLSATLLCATGLLLVSRP